MTEKPTIAERVLLWLSRPPGDTASAQHDEWTVENALATLTRAFPDLLARVAGRDVLDFGCGTGYQAVALAMAGAARVVGVDTNARTLERARYLARRIGIEDRVVFLEKVAPPDVFDLVISQNSMEHFPDPVETLDQLISLARADGRILITFGPPWFAPYGTHMQFFTAVPWVNLLFTERTVMRVRARFRSDGAMRYEEVESGLNRMTVGKFERLLKTAPARVVFRRYDGVKGIDFLTRVPGVRELFVNHISCELQPTRR